MTLWADELKVLRQELVEVYMQPVLDVDKAGNITKRMRELVSEMRAVDRAVLVELRRCYDADIGCTETARRLAMPTSKVLNYYYQFSTEDGNRVQAKVDLGDPTLERSALATYQPWKPKLDNWKPNKPRPVAEGHRQHHPGHKGPGYYKGVPPTGEQLKAILEVASDLTGSTPEKIKSGLKGVGGSNQNVVRARGYAALALRYIFADVSPAILAGMVGIEGSSRKVYISMLESRVRSGVYKWFNQAYLDQVMAACPRKMETAA